MQAVTFSIAGMVIVIGGVLILLLGLRLSAASEDERRLARYVTEPPQAVEAIQLDPLAFRRAELQGSFRQRMLQPAFKALGAVLGRMTPARSMDTLGHQLMVAGYPLGLGAREFYGLNLLFTFLSIWLAFSFVRGGLAKPAPTPRVGSALVASPAEAAPRLDLNRAGGAILVLLIGTRLPKMWLRSRVRRRQKAIRRNLPDALDMLSVCAEAGLGFDQSLQRVSDHWKTPLGLEFARVVQEMNMGLSRAEALRSLAARIDVAELSSFIAVIIQSDEMGMSITDVLRAQAEQMRVERRHRAQEEARKAPLKMLFPMLLLIFPAIMAVVLGPTIPAFIDVFGTIMSTTSQY